MRPQTKGTFVLCAFTLAACATGPDPALSLHLLKSPTPVAIASSSVVETAKSEPVTTAVASVPPATLVSSETVALPDQESVLVHNDAGPRMAPQEASPDEDEDVEVDEPAVPAPETEDVAKDSERSPEEIAEIVPREGPVEAHFALCEDSVFMRQWENDFDRLWLEENSKRFKHVKDRNRALAAARSEAFVKLVFPTMASFLSDYPTVVNRDVLNWVEYFQTRGRKAMVTWLKRGEDVIPVAQPILERYGLPKDLIYLSMIESGFSNRARSIASAVGAWQFIRSTGKMYGLRIDDFVDERRDPVRSTEAAARFLSDLYVSLGDWHLAAASYNAGQGRIQRALRRSSESDFFSLSAAKLLPNETRNYVPKLIAALFIGKYPSVFGFEVEGGSRALRTKTISIQKPLALSDLARETGMDVAILEDLNPALRVGVTPPPTASRPSYLLRVPESMTEKMIATVEALPEASLQRLVAGRVGRRETVARFASRVGMPLREFLKANPKLGPKSTLAKGQNVMLAVRLGTGQYEKLTAMTADKKASRAKAKKSYAGKKKSKSKVGAKISSTAGASKAPARKSSMKTTRSKPRG